MGDSERVLIRVETEISAIDPSGWDASANPDPATYNPFISHAFLSALEEAGCVSAEEGWLPQHLILDDGKGGVLGTMPCYLKSHSLGEYVFDHGWADAYERAGGQYYPKLLSAVPFSPVTGRRLLVPPSEDASDREHALASAAVTLTNRHDVSSLHINFLTKSEWERIGNLGFLQRTDQQFHWQNEGYESFEEFLATLTSRKRKALRKERREALSSGIEIDWIYGSDIKEHHWDTFFEFYMNTGRRKWGSPYLNRTFFSLLSAKLKDRILLIFCRRGDHYIAGALNLIGGDTLYGRYWGCLEQNRFLHFETCYYQAMDYAIAHGIKHIEAGAQGAHKLVRGYLPKTTYSAHYITDPNLRGAIAEFLAEERRYVEMENNCLAAQSPYRKK